jgi:lipoate-protein ligase A
MRLRVLDFGTVSALRSQAVFHGLAFAMSEADDPILCLSSPATPYVCVGMHQEIAKEVDEEFCKARDLPIYRRRIGGGAVYLDKNQLFTHFIYPHAKAPQLAANLYPMFIEPVVRTYRELGIEAVYRPVNDIQVNGRKIGGTGAASIGEATVMAGSFMFDFDTETMAQCLKVPSEKFRDKLRAGLNDYMTTIVKELDDVPDRSVVKAAFLRHCAEVLSVTPEQDRPTDAEIRAIDGQEAAISDPKWTYQQGRKFVAMGVKLSADTHMTEAAHKAPGGLIRVHLLEREKKIADLMLTGDFTCLPPEGIDELAKSAVGSALSAEALEARFGEEIARRQIDLPGVSPADLATAVLAAVHQ